MTTPTTIARYNFRIGGLHRLHNEGDQHHRAPGQENKDDERERTVFEKVVEFTSTSSGLHSRMHKEEIVNIENEQLE
jgi:hypothetical protein